MNSTQTTFLTDWPIFLWQALTLTFVLTLLLELEPRLVIGIIYLATTIVIVLITQSKWPPVIKWSNLAFVLVITLLLFAYTVLPIILASYAQTIRIFFLFLLIFFWFFWRSRLFSTTTVGKVIAVTGKVVTVQTFFDARAGTNSARITFSPPKKKLKVGSIISLETKPSFLGQKVTPIIIEK